MLAAAFAAGEKQVFSSKRHLRPIVIARKLSFDGQSERGMHTREILMSILHTAQCRGLDPGKFLEQILNTLTIDPPPISPELFRTSPEATSCLSAD